MSVVKYILLSDKVEGFVTYSFDKLGYLNSFRNCAWKITEKQVRWILEQIGYALTVNGFLQWVRQHGYAVRKVEEDLSFERFYKEYGIARDKDRAEQIWKKIKTDEEKQYIFYNHEAYQRYCDRNKSWYNKMYLKTYLASHTHDEWDKIETAVKK